MRFSRSVVQEVRECPYGGLKAACPHCIPLVVQEATMRAHSRRGEQPLIRLAWLIGIIEREPGLEQSLRRVMRQARATKKNSVTSVYEVVTVKRSTESFGLMGHHEKGPTMAEMRVSLEGQSAAGTTLSAVPGNATGTAVDGTHPHGVATVVAVGTGTLAGTLTIEGSLDGTAWVSTGTTVALSAAATVTATSTGKAFRFFRTSLSSATGTGSCTALMGVV
ncbi:hypothetical protein AB0F77_17055 [Streptomyces sp. NPDC026672]|uniref:hypothetical protein n=1 Tax=unclassified Streptomyces TaxID=2593676 RepID=UPI0033C1A592